VRWVALWVLLFGVYAATLGIPAFGASDYGGDEPHHLLTARSIVEDADIDLANQYADGQFRAFYPYVLDVHGQRTDGRIAEPHSIGFPLLIAPAYALGGARAVEVLMAALMALAFVLAGLLARRLVPEPWATGGVALVGLSPPAIAYSTAVLPEVPAATLLALAALLALRVRESPRLRNAYGSALALAVLPWLATRFAVPALAVAVLLVRWASRRGRRLAALGVGEVMVASVVALVTVNDVFFGGFTPGAAGDPGRPSTGASSVGDYLERVPRLAALWLDRDYGLLRWAPVLALSFAAVWLLWRSRRERLAEILPLRLDTEIAAALLLAVCGAVVLVAAFAAPTMFGFWFPGRHLVAALPCAAALAAWALRSFPRVGTALGAVTVAASVWLVVDLRTGAREGWIGLDTSAPWGPLERVFPLWGVGSVWADAVGLALLAALVAVVAREWRRWRAAELVAVRRARA
jgi:hypothetical protein